MRPFLGIVLSVLFSSSAYAQSLCGDLGGSYTAVLACAESRSPEVQNAELELRKAEAQIGAAGQWQNPELSAETFRNTEGNSTKSETDISVGIPIEIGKISSRKDVARGGQSLAEAKLFEAKAKVRSEVLLKLHRLRQVLHEQELINEAVATFSKLVGQYARRPGLSPEQKISSSVFNLSKSEYDLKKSASDDELLALDSYFKIITGLSVEQLKKAFPESPKNWPPLPSKGKITASPQMRILKAEWETAQAELDLAKSDAWPTITIGPSLKIEKDGARSEKQWGANIGFPIPIFSLNSGQKAAAAAGAAIGESRYEIGLREQALKRDELEKIYSQSVQALNNSLSHREIEKRHSDAESLFSKGVIPSALVIEVHRTSFELEKSRHERELKALESLLGIYSMDGNILEVSL